MNRKERRETKRMLKLMERNLRNAAKVCIETSQSWDIKAVRLKLLESTFKTIRHEVPAKESQLYEFTIAYNLMIHTFIDTANKAAKNMHSKSVSFAWINRTLDEVIEKLHKGAFPEKE